MIFWLTDGQLAERKTHKYLQNDIFMQQTAAFVNIPEGFVKDSDSRQKTAAVLKKSTAVFEKTARVLKKTRAVLNEYLC